MTGADDEQRARGTPRQEDVPVKAFPERRHGIRSYLIANAFQVAIAVEAIITACIYFADPGSPNAAAALAGPGFAWVWNAFYVLAGLTTVAGMIRLSIWLEIAGLGLLVAALSVNATAIGLYVPSWEAFAVYVLLTGACVLRVRLLVKLVRTRMSS